MGELFLVFVQRYSEGTPGYKDEFLHLAQVVSSNLGEETVHDNNILNTEISRHEVKLAVQEARNNKAVSIDELPNEVFKNDYTIDMLWCLFNCCLNKSVIPSIWQKSILTPVYKGKNKDR